MRQRGNTILWTTLHQGKWPFKNAWIRGLPYFHLKMQLVTNIRNWGIKEARWGSATSRSVALGTRVRVGQIVPRVTIVEGNVRPCKAVVGPLTRGLAGRMVANWWLSFCSTKRQHVFVGKLIRVSRALSSPHKRCVSLPIWELHYLQCWAQEPG